MPDRHKRFMREALKQARIAARRGEVPVGAVVVREGTILAKARNEIVSRHDPCAHAELLAIQRAAKRTRNERLTGCVLYSTLEPCPMCAGAAVLARIEAMVFGARDKRAGALGSQISISDLRGLNHRFGVTKGVLSRESSEMLRKFFRKRR